MGDTCSRGQKKLIVAPNSITASQQCEGSGAKPSGKLVQNERSRTHLALSNRHNPLVLNSRGNKAAEALNETVQANSRHELFRSPGTAQHQKRPGLDPDRFPAVGKEAAARHHLRRPPVSQESFSNTEKTQKARPAINAERPINSFASTTEVVEVKSRETGTFSSIQNLAAHRENVSSLNVLSLQRPSKALRVLSGLGTRPASPRAKEELALSKNETEEPEEPKSKDLLQPCLVSRLAPEGKRTKWLCSELVILPVKPPVSHHRAVKLPFAGRALAHESGPARERGRSPSGTPAAGPDASTSGRHALQAQDRRESLKRVHLTVKGAAGAETGLPGNDRPGNARNPRKIPDSASKIVSMPQILVASDKDRPANQGFSKFRPPELKSIRSGLRDSLQRSSSNHMDFPLPPTPIFCAGAFDRELRESKQADRPGKNSPSSSGLQSFTLGNPQKDSQSEKSAPGGDSFLYESFSQANDPLKQLEQILAAPRKDSG